VTSESSSKSFDGSWAVAFQRDRIKAGGLLETTSRFDTMRNAETGNYCRNFFVQACY
jgi:hypothetical protein